jgi:hypothetical protein
MLTSKEIKNVEAKIEGGKLHLTIDLNKNFGPSKSGKTLTVAQTGFAKIDGKDGYGLTLSVWAPKAAAPAAAS